MTARHVPTGPGNTGRTVLDFPSSRPQPLPLPRFEQAIRAARADGECTGYRSGYIDGWRWGTVCGALIGMLTGAGAIVAGLKLGLIAGGAL